VARYMEQALQDESSAPPIRIYTLRFGDKFEPLPPRGRARGYGPRGYR